LASLNAVQTEDTLLIVKLLPRELKNPNLHRADPDAVRALLGAFHRVALHAEEAEPAEDP